MKAELLRGLSGIGCGQKPVQPRAGESQMHEPKTELGGDVVIDGAIVKASAIEAFAFPIEVAAPLIKETQHMMLAARTDAGRFYEHCRSLDRPESRVSVWLSARLGLS